MNPGNYSSIDKYVKAQILDMDKLAKLVDERISQEHQRRERIRITTGHYPDESEVNKRIKQLEGSPFSIEEKADLIFGNRDMEDIFNEWRYECDACFTTQKNGA